MSHPNPSTAIGRVIADELVRHGVQKVVASPGSRSTSLLLAFDEIATCELTMNIDERSAGFRALGNAVSGDPGLGVVVTTSGSAVANLMPAVVEADRACVPMVVITADRPAVMVARRTNQTMDQLSLLRDYVRHQSDLGPAVDIAGSNEGWREATSTAVARARGVGGRRPGPVHLNVAFEEPTVPIGDDGRSKAEPFRSNTSGRSGGGRWTGDDVTSVGSPLGVEMGKRTVLILGRGDYDPGPVKDLAARHGIPVLATTLSGARGGGIVSTYHHLLADGVPPSLRPDTTVVVGQPGPSDRLTALMSDGVRVVHIDPWGNFSDISGTMSAGIREEPLPVLQRSAVAQEEAWADGWLRADTSMRTQLNGVLETIDEPTGPGIAAALDTIGWSALVAASSLPIRDVDAHMTRAGWSHANRGVSGIDGFASTAIGVADHRSGCLALGGDLSFLHDSNAFLTDRMPNITFLVVDNGGGGLFDLLPQARHARNFERLFITPPNRDLGSLAAFHGLDYADCASIEDAVTRLDTALGAEGVTVVRVGVDRNRDIEARNALDAAARELSAR